MNADASAGAIWLAGFTGDPGSAFVRWQRGELARIPSGRGWLVAEAPLMHSIRAMGRLSPSGKLGPVLGHAEADRAWWLLPLDAEHHLAHLAGQLTVHTPGWPLPCPSPDRYAHGRGWLEKPEGNGTLTAPAALRSALGNVGALPAEAGG
ncbi:hypothetical protein [Streptomyces sp. ODS28]|uniref:hypothetical protein n=1 Tax=Streptomyces sp. ODS28 TaxID=3136688 RepID=UPI0031E66612